MDIIAKVLATLLTILVSDLRILPSPSFLHGLKTHFFTALFYCYIYFKNILDACLDFHLLMYLLLSDLFLINSCLTSENCLSLLPPMFHVDLLIILVLCVHTC